MKKPETFWLISGLCWLAYVISYFGRVNLSITLPYLQSVYGYSKASLGMVALGFFGAYAAGQLINGVLGDRFNPRYFISIGLLFAGVSNIFFGITHNLGAMILFWAINGYFQSMLWGPLVRIISGSTPKQHLPKFAALFFIILMAAFKGNIIMVILAFFCILGSIFAANNMLIAFVPLNFQREDRISSTAGFLDCAVYIGAAISSPLAGMLADRFGWNGVIRGWIGVCVAAIILAIVSRNYSHPKFSDLL
jgi:sugar phosphate permease